MCPLCLVLSQYGDSIIMMPPSEHMLHSGGPVPTGTTSAGVSFHYKRGASSILLATARDHYSSRHAKLASQPSGSTQRPCLSHNDHQHMHSGGTTACGRVAPHTKRRQHKFLQPAAPLKTLRAR